MEDLQSLILSELRDLRTDYNEEARQTRERLAALDEQMHDLAGNGQPGRVTRIETAVAELQKWHWKVIGAAATVSGVVSVLAWVFVHATH